MQVRKFFDTVAGSLSRRVVILAIAFPTSTFALVGGSGPDPNVANSPWNGVGSLTVSGNKFTATLIAPGYILTAAHVLAGKSPSEITFQLNAGSPEMFTSERIFLNPEYTGTTMGNLSNDPTVHADIAIVKLTGTPNSSTNSYGLYLGDVRGQDLTFVSYAGSDTVKRTGANTADVVFANSAGVQKSYLFDFDGPDLSTNRLGFDIASNGTLGSDREASFVIGDSGSSAFIEVEGRWQLAGINTFQAVFAEGPTVSGTFGTGGGGIVLSSYASWINGVLAAPVPEPAPWMPLVSGIGLMTIALGGRRKQRSNKV